MKIVLAIGNDSANAVYLFKKSPDITEFVVASPIDDNTAVGEIVDGWYRGTYYDNLGDALEEFRRRIGDC